MSKQVKTSVTIAGHRTSVSLEQPFLDALKEIAAHKNLSINDLITTIDRERSTSQTGNGLSSAIRLFVLDYYRREDQR